MQIKHTPVSLVSLYVHGNPKPTINGVYIVQESILMAKFPF